MGSGKSSVGRRLAAKQGRDFLDTDAEVIAAAGGISISNIFAQEGEEGFRNRESDALRNLVSRQGIVLATGGGLILREENRSLLRKLGIVVWLYALPDILFERVMRSRKRPLLQVENPREEFDSLLATRKDFYLKSADFSIDSSHLNHDETALKVLDAIAEWKRERVLN